MLRAIAQVKQQKPQSPSVHMPQLRGHWKNGPPGAKAQKELKKAQDDLAAARKELDNLKKLSLIHI